MTFNCNITDSDGVRTITTRANYDTAQAWLNEAEALIAQVRDLNEVWQDSTEADSINASLDSLGMVDTDLNGSVWIEEV